MNLDDLRYRIPEFSREHRKVLFALAGGGILLALTLFLFTRGSSTEITTSLPTPSISPIAMTIYVDVAGRVMKPGVYQLSVGSRAIDAITLAGGARPGTDVSDINLAHIVVDGEQIYVGANIPGAHGPHGKLNINRATQSQLDGLPGIGPVLAARIISYRNKNGAFLTVDELQKVSGIGGSKFDDIKELLRV